MPYINKYLAIDMCICDIITISYKIALNIGDV